jgi:hypothetical protein
MVVVEEDGAEHVLWVKVHFEAQEYNTENMVIVMLYPWLSTLQAIILGAKMINSSPFECEEIDIRADFLIL